MNAQPTELLKSIHDVITSSPELQQKLKHATTVAQTAELLSAATSKTITENELISLSASIKSELPADMSDEDLEKVNGGALFIGTALLLGIPIIASALGIAGGLAAVGGGTALIHKYKK